jgi:hypothetical protein
MKLYRLSQSRNSGWYTYDSAVVVAASKEEARLIIPSPFYFYDDGFYYQFKHQEAKPEATDPSWCHPRFVKVEELGEASLKGKPRLITASYNAGFDESRYLDLRRLKTAIKYHPSEGKRAIAQNTIDTIQRQLKDRGLTELRYHLIEANRTHDLEKTQEYELKIRDYENQTYEDWS